MLIDLTDDYSKIVWNEIIPVGENFHYLYTPSSLVAEHVSKDDLST